MIVGQKDSEAGEVNRKRDSRTQEERAEAELFGKKRAGE